MSAMRTIILLLVVVTTGILATLIFAWQWVAIATIIGSMIFSITAYRLLYRRDERERELRRLEYERIKAERLAKLSDLN